MVENKQTPASDMLALIEEIHRRLAQVESQLGQDEDHLASSDTVRAEGDSDDTVNDLELPWNRPTITRTALNQTGVVVLVIDPAGMIIHADGAVEELIGNPVADVLGKSVWETIVPDNEVVQVQLTFAELHAGRRRNRHRSTRVSNAGQRSAISWSNAAIPDASGDVKYIVSAGIGVPEPASDVSFLQTDGERYRRLIDSSPDVIWEYEFVGLRDAAARIEQGATTLESVCDPNMPEVEMRAVFVSPAVEQLLGFTPAEMLSRSLHQHLTPNCLEICYQILARQLEQELAGVRTDPVVVELEERHKNGTIVWTRGKIQFTRDEAGFPTGVAGISSDITRERQIERALQESLEQFRVLVESTPVAILVHTRGQLVYANPQAARLFRADSPEHLVGRDLWDIIHPDFREQVKQRMLDVLRHRNVAPIQEITLLRVDGTAFVAESMGVPITYDGERAVQVVLADVGERQRIQQQERQRDEIRTRLDQLSPREREVLRFVVAGKPNKTIASQLGISIKTVEHHRSNMMKKAGVNSVAELVRITLLSEWSSNRTS